MQHACWNVQCADLMHSWTAQSHSVTPGWLTQTGSQWDFSTLLLFSLTEEMGSGFQPQSDSDNSSRGEQNMVAPSAIIQDWLHLLIRNASSTSKLKLLWLYTKQNICRWERSLSTHHRFLCGSHSPNSYLLLSHLIIWKCLSFTYQIVKESISVVFKGIVWQFKKCAYWLLAER